MPQNPTPDIVLAGGPTEVLPLPPSNPFWGYAWNTLKFSATRHPLVFIIVTGAAIVYAMSSSGDKGSDSSDKSESTKQDSANINGDSNENQVDKEDKLRPGDNAKESIPASGPRITKKEQDEINDIGDKHGCHSCGAESPGTKSGNWVGDHQPPSKLNPEGKAQRLYPHCLRCSKSQGGQVRHKKLKNEL